MRTESTGQEPRRASLIEDPHSLSLSVSAPAVLTDYAGASCPVRFRWQTYAGVLLFMACCVALALILVAGDRA